MDKPGCAVSIAIVGFLALITGSQTGIVIGAVFLIIGVTWFYFGLAESKAKDQIIFESNAGNYIMGLPSRENPIPNIKMLIEDDEVALYQVQSSGSSSLSLKPPPPNLVRIGSIPLRLINDINVTDRSVLERRFGGLIGIRVGFGGFAVPMQRQIYHELFYLVISWADGKFERHTVLEFPGIGSHQRANRLANELIKEANKL
jgi:hypothetical protein